MKQNKLCSTSVGTIERKMKNGILLETWKPKVTLKFGADFWQPAVECSGMAGATTYRRFWNVSSECDVFRGLFVGDAHSLFRCHFIYCCVELFWSIKNELSGDWESKIQLSSTTFHTCASDQLWRPSCNSRILKHYQMMNEWHACASTSRRENRHVMIMSTANTATLE